MFTINILTKNKNCQDFCGKPMFIWNLEKCLDIFDRVYVSSDSDEILELATRLEVIP
jgi:CMP-N-acetylneuraminic acid synthetase